MIFSFFFFSSRRRHTRSDRDWSSDVCSSDLNSLPFVVGDGVHPATFQLLGGTYSFANGLVISNNATVTRSEEHTSELQSRSDLVCRLLLEKKKTTRNQTPTHARRRSAPR